MRAWRAWVALCDRREPATAQALVRIGVGLCLVYDLLYQRAVGVVEATWAAPPFGIAYGARAGQWAFDWFGATPATAQLLWAVSLATILAVTLGLATRVAALGFVLVSAVLGHMAPDCDRGIDQMLRIVVLVLAFSSCHGRWSVDAWFLRRIGRPFPSLVPAWPRYALFVQLCWIYFSSGSSKVGAEWGPFGDFAALANVLSDPHVARWGSAWVPHLYPLLQLATIATMVFELGAPAMIPLTWLHGTADRPGRIRRLCNRLRLRWIWIGLGVSMHVGIAAFMNIGIFPWGMLALYPVLLHPEELAAIGARLRRVRTGY